MAIRIGGPRIEAPPPPPKLEKLEPTKPAPPPSAKKLELNQSSEFGNEIGEGSAQVEAEFSGKVTVPLEINGQQEQVQLTSLEGVLSHNGQEVGRVVGSAPEGQLEVEIAGKRAIVTPERAPPPTPGELLPYPSGRPETYIKTQFPPTPSTTADRQTMIDTVVSVLPREKQAETRSLLETGGGYGKDKGDSGGELLTAGVSDASLKKAFDQVLEARKSPGQKQLSLDLIPERHMLVQDVGSESNAGPREIVEQGKPIALKFGMSVDAQGQVNGAALKVDQLTRLSTELTKVGPDLKQEALKSAGLSDEWLNNSTTEQQEMALAKLREATLTPGTKKLDLGFDMQVQTGGGDEGQSYATKRVEATLTLKVDDKGNVDGKPLFIETALATNKVFEQLPIAEKKAMLQNIGFAAEDLKPVGADRMTDILSRIAMKSREPGQHQLLVDNGPDKFAVGLKVGQNGELEGVGVTKLPPPPKVSTFKKIIGPVLTVVSVVFPVTAPFIAVIQAGMAVANGAKGLGLVGAVLGGAAGVAGIAGFAGAASTLSSAAQVVNGVNGAVQGIKTGDFLSAFSSAVSAAGGVGGLTGTPIVGATLATAGQVAGIGSSIKNKDFGGALGSVVGMVGAEIRSRNQAAENAKVVPPPPDDDLGGATVQMEVSKPAGDPSNESDGLDGLEPRTLPMLDVSRIGGEDDGISMSLVPDDLFVGPPAPPEPLPEPEKTVTVKRGDTLSALAEKHLGDASKWPELYKLNKDAIGDNPNKLPAGVELAIPPVDYEMSPSEKNGLFNSAVMPPKTNESGAQLLGFDENQQPVYSDIEPIERAEVKKEISDSFKPSKNMQTAMEITKALGDLSTLIKDPVLEGRIAKALAGGNTAILGELLKDENIVTRLAARLPEAAQGKLASLMKFTDYASKGVTAFEGYQNSASDSMVGKLASGGGALLGELVLGRYSKALDVIDSAVGLAGAGFNAGVNAIAPGTDVQVNTDAISLKKTVGAGYQNLAVIAEAMFSSPERRDELMTKLYENNQKGPLLVRGATLLGQAFSGSSLGMFLADKAFEFQDKLTLKAQERARQEWTRGRPDIVRKGG